MMHYTIFVLLLITTASFAQSVQIKDLPMEDLHSTKLAALQLATFEEQALLKLQDVLDYIAIIGSHKYDLAMREATLNSVLMAFDKETKLFCDRLELTKATPKKEQKATCQPKDILEKLLKNAVYEVQFNYNKLKIREKLSPQMDGSYKGSLFYEQQLNTKKQVEKDKWVEGDVNFVVVHFVLKRVQKKFGTQQEEVWEIQLLGF